MNYFIGKFDFLKVYGEWQKVSRRQVNEEFSIGIFLTFYN